MLSRSLTTEKTVFKRLVVGASRSAARRRSRTGLARRPRERPDLVADDRRGLAQRTGRVSSSAGPSARANGRSAWKLGPSSAASVSTLPSVSSRGRERRREELQRAAEVGLLLGEDLEVRVRRVDERRRAACPSWPAPRRAAGSCGSPAQRSSRRSDSSPVNFFEVAVRGLEALERLAQVRGVRLRVRPGRVVGERLAAGVGEDLEVRARVAVELGEDLVGVHVRAASAPGRCARPRAARPRACVPGSSSTNMSFSPVFGRRSIVASR